MKDVVKKIREIRVQKGYSQEYLASQLSISQQAYCEYENGKVTLSLEKLEKICTVLEISPEELFTNNDYSQSNNDNTQNPVNNSCSNNPTYNFYNGIVDNEFAENQKLILENQNKILDFLTNFLKNNLK
jgi:transcriptional regulator with XRE-family HTH domain